MNETKTVTPLDRLKLARSGPEIESPVWAGIDQSGTGEALGPLVVVMVHMTPGHKIPPIRECKKASSRDYAIVQELLASGVIEYRSIEISPSIIDEYNVKNLITEAQRRLLARLSGMVYIDCHWVDETGLKNQLQKYCSAQLIVKNHLDVQNSLVAAASLIAKKIRTQRLYQIEALVDRKIGSGNLTDPQTIAYLRSGMTIGLRKKWSLKSIGL